MSDDVTNSYQPPIVEARRVHAFNEAVRTTGSGFGPIAVPLDDVLEAAGQIERYLREGLPDDGA